MLFQTIYWKARRKSGNMATRGNPNFGDEAMDATRQILNTGSAAIDMAMLIADLGREVPIASTVLQAFLAIHDMVETIRANKEDLKDLRDRCGYLTVRVVDECRRHRMAINVNRLEDILRDTADVIERCGGRKWIMRIRKATSDKNEIQSLNTRLNQLGIDMGLAATFETLVSTFGPITMHVHVLCTLVTIFTSVIYIYI